MNPKRSKSRHGHKMPLVHPNAAAIDVGATMHMAAVRADRAPEPVRSFGTFTAERHVWEGQRSICGPGRQKPKNAQRKSSAVSGAFSCTEWSI